jgi:hypothetical protein
VSSSPNNHIFFAKFYNILRWAIVPPGRPSTTNRLTGRAWAAAAARRPIWARHASLAGPDGPCRVGPYRPVWPSITSRTYGNFFHQPKGVWSYSYEAGDLTMRICDQPITLFTKTTFSIRSNTPPAVPVPLPVPRTSRFSHGHSRSTLYTPRRLVRPAKLQPSCPAAGLKALIRSVPSPSIFVSQRGRKEATPRVGWG